MSINRDRLRLDLKRDEGPGIVRMGRSFPYKDVGGVLTIGYGHNLDAKGLTLAQADRLLDDDIDDAYRDLLARFLWAGALDPVRQAVLVNMCFNLGINRLSGFTQTLGHVERHEFDAAAVGMLASAWADQVGARARRLAEQMRTGLLL